MDDTTPAGGIAGFRSETVSVGGVRLHYWLGGNPAGQPVVLWHGFLSTSYAWRKVAPALADAGMAVLVPDMRGFGDSDKPGGTEGYDARALAEEFRALVRKTGFGSGRPIICRNSFGWLVTRTPSSAVICLFTYSWYSASFSVCMPNFLPLCIVL